MILEEGRNCWLIRPADRLAFLVDGAAYFGALRMALYRARRRVLIIGWDVDSRVDLSPGGAQDDLPGPLLPFLNAVLERRPGLEVFVLGWDFSMIYTFEREPLPELRFGLRAHPRLKFALDGAHPLGASHHQKIVVVDDALGFTGGLDLTIRRWDTSEHLARNAHRVDHNGVAYGPIHDVQMMVDGQAAAALGALARQRWWLATGARLGAEPTGDSEPWPDGFSPDILNVPVGIARTAPEWAGSQGVHEIEALILDAVAAARSDIYVENQYLTSGSVAHALANRLRDPDGPGVTVVLPREECGWLEQSSMGLLREGVIRRLRAADRFNRLRLLHPVVPELDGALNLHSKVMIVDDQLAWVGSANLSNRSMGLDTEIVLALDATLEPRLSPAIVRFRDRLLAEHLGRSPAELRPLLDDGGVVHAVDSVTDGARRLEPLLDTIREAPAINFAILDGVVCDPERPAPDKLLALMVPGEMRAPVHRSLLRWAGLLIAVLGLVALWRFTPLGEYRHLERLAALGETVRNSSWTPLIVLGAYLGGALVLFPITAMLTATALVFPSVWGVLYGLVGGVLAALLTYGLGRALGQQRMRWMARPRVVRFQRQLQRRGLIAVIAARMLPIGNFSLFNMVAGALHIRLRDYVVGNVLGILPGLVTLVLLAHNFGSALKRPKASSFALLAVVVLGAVLGIAWLRRKLRREVIRGQGAGPRAETTAP